MRDRVAALLNRLWTLPEEANPSIDRLLEECPELRLSDWINVTVPRPSG